MAHDFKTQVWVASWLPREWSLPMHRIQSTGHSEHQATVYENLPFRPLIKDGLENTGPLQYPKTTGGSRVVLASFRQDTWSSPASRSRPCHATSFLAPSLVPTETVVLDLHAVQNCSVVKLKMGRSSRAWLQGLNSRIKLMEGCPRLEKDARGPITGSGILKASEQ